MNTALLKEGLKKLNIAADNGQIDQIKTFAAEIERWNHRMNLVRASGDTLIVRHILDSLAGLPVIREMSPAKLLDVGAGAGLPGIPLAIFLPDTHVTLLDRSTKRTSFLRNAVALLGLSTCIVAEHEIEQERGSYDVVCCRAFQPVERVFSVLAARLNPGGSLVFYKGTDASVTEELEALRMEALGIEALGFTVERVAISVPFLEEERQLLLFRDTSR